MWFKSTNMVLLLLFSVWQCCMYLSKYCFISDDSGLLMSNEVIFFSMIWFPSSSVPWLMIFSVIISCWFLQMF